MNISEFLAEQDARYEPDVRLPWRSSRSNGYHTRLPAGTRVHETRESADYALALLQVGRDERARDILDALLDLQVTDPVAEHYGLWGYFLEEPPHQMAPADWNWADFIGIRLAQVLAVHDDRLTPALRARLREGLRHAAMSVFRRNVGPQYTNIALLGAVTAAAAGELLEQGHLLDYARRRLDALLARLAEDGGFAEYNSPAYSPFLLEIVERAALIVRDQDFLEAAERLRVRVWETIAERFHPGTGQLAGPHARAYADWLRPGLVDYLSAQTGAPIEVRERGSDDGDLTPRLMPSLPCPPHVARRFAALPQEREQVRTTFGAGPRGPVTGTTWLTGDACLGTASEEFAWTQRRPLIGYWRTPEDPAVVLRARMTLNGHDLSAAWCTQAQDGPKALSAWWLSYDSGDFHPNLDKPAGSVFDVGELRLLVSLRGRGVSGEDLGGGRFALAAGERRAVVHTAPASFLGEPASWELAKDGDEVRAEVLLHAEPRRPVDFHTALLRAAFAVELLAPGEDPSADPLGLSDLCWRWGGLAVEIPERPLPFDA